MPLDGPSEAELPVFDKAQSWKKSDMCRRTDWVHQLTAEEIADINRAVEGVQRSGKDILLLTQDDSELRAFAKPLAALRRDLLSGRGFFLVRGVPVDQYSRREAIIAFFGLSLHIGQPVSQNGKGHILGHVKNLGLNVEDPETRGYQTNARLKYHTDYSDVVGLLCLQT